MSTSTLTTSNDTHSKQTNLPSSTKPPMSARPRPSLRLTKARAVTGPSLVSEYSSTASMAMDGVHKQ